MLTSTRKINICHVTVLFTAIFIINRTIYFNYSFKNEITLNLLCINICDYIYKFYILEIIPLLYISR